MQEKKYVALSVDMVSNHAAVFSDKKLHMYEFPKSVQEWMYNACEFGESHEIQRLFNLKKTGKCMLRRIHIFALRYMYYIWKRGRSRSFAERTGKQFKFWKNSGR